MYDCAIKLTTKRDGPVIKNQMQLPHALRPIRIAVICKPDSPTAKAAQDAGAALVGDEEIFAMVKAGRFEFDRCLTTPDMLPRIGKEGLPRILGPRGLMPSEKLGTVTENVGETIRNMVGGSIYRERTGVIRMAIGQLGFTPEMLKENLRAFVSKIKQDSAKLVENNPAYIKEVEEIVSQLQLDIAEHSLTFHRFSVRHIHLDSL